MPANSGPTSGSGSCVMNSPRLRAETPGVENRYAQIDRPRSASNGSTAPVDVRYSSARRSDGILLKLHTITRSLNVRNRNSEAQHTRPRLRAAAARSLGSSPNARIYAGFHTVGSLCKNPRNGIDCANAPTSPASRNDAMRACSSGGSARKS
eukprot:Amastigsp_a524654_7.p2 type:complete len:152 gc:universal Amastigsp_a524654_7:329-784(+)